MKPRREPWTNATARGYLIVGLAAAFVLGMALFERGSGMWAVLAPLIGAAGIAFGWVVAPVFVMLGTTMALLVAAQFPISLTSRTADFMLAGALTAYALAHFRVCAITCSVFPHDSRRVLQRKPKPRTGLPWYIELPMALTLIPYMLYALLGGNRGRREKKQTPLPPRAASQPSSGELPRGLVSVVAASACAIGVWWATSRPTAPFRAIAQQWQLGVIAWCVIAPVIVVAVVVGYRSLCRESVEVARLRLLESCWRETRREQRGLSRWTSWARRRQDAGK